ncbi:META domain-containing protein [Rhodococcus triatomae]|nr:META domain-containing protein [Rhodococcus triatomae]QNG19320.1 META domain-containing protein [Rhodococcus triatomae]QNG24767.1 META domain-containing protein [Rhodococcus triatomae]
MRRIVAVLGLTSLSIATLAACSDDTQAQTSDPSGRTFVSTAVDGDRIPGGGPLTLGFPEPGRIVADAGCNRASGTVDLSDGTLSTGPLAMTMMACVGEAETADAWMQELLESGPQWTLDGDTFTLNGDRSTVTLTDEKVVRPDRPISGTEWAVASLVSDQAITTSRALEESAPHFTIAEDGALTGFAGCNSMTGSAIVSGETVVFEPIATTRMACPPDVMEVETAVLAALTGEATATVDGDTMRLRRADGVGLDVRATS